MAYKSGDKVAFLHEKGHGTVIRVVSAHKVMVELAEGLEIEMSVKDLAPVNPKALTDTPVRYKDSSKSQPKSQAKAKPHARDLLIVDLHAEKLDEHSYSMTNAQKLTLQLDYFQDSLDRAIRGHAKKVIFIHGVGNGVLRQSIRDILKRYDGIEVSDGSYQQFGRGATEVRIISRNKFRESF